MQPVSALFALAFVAVAVAAPVPAPAPFDLGDIGDLIKGLESGTDLVKGLVSGNLTNVVNDVISPTGILRAIAPLISSL